MLFLFLFTAQISTNLHPISLHINRTNLQVRINIKVQAVAMENIHHRRQIKRDPEKILEIDIRIKRKAGNTND